MNFDNTKVAIVLMQVNCLKGRVLQMHNQSYNNFNRLFEPHWTFSNFSNIYQWHCNICWWTKLHCTWRMQQSITPLNWASIIAAVQLSALTIEVIYFYISTTCDNIQSFNDSCYWIQLQCMCDIKPEQHPALTSHQMLNYRLFYPYSVEALHLMTFKWNWQSADTPT